MFLEKEINELESFLKSIDLEKASVSSVSVGWHIDHALRAIYVIIKSLQRSEPANYKWRFNLGRIFILTFKYIPRGTAKAPKNVISQSNINKERILVLLEKTKASIPQLSHLQPTNFFIHADAGYLKLKAAKKFLEIHTTHHIKIIEDILK